MIKLPQIPCKHYKRPKSKPPTCAISKAEHPTYTFCLRECESYCGRNRAKAFEKVRAKLKRQTKPPLTIGLAIRLAIHFGLDCLDAFIRPRNRLKIYIIEKIKTCSGCKWREVLIDRYALHLINKLRGAC